MKKQLFIPLLSLTLPLVACFDNSTPELRLSEVAKLGTLNTISTEYKFTSNLAGTIQYLGDCSADSMQATEGENTIIFNNLEWWKAYSNCGITVTSNKGKVASTLNITSFEVAPRFIENTPLNISHTLAPAYSFYADAIGSLDYLGDCSADTKQAIAGENIIVFNNLEWWKSYENCELRLSSLNGDAYSTLKVSPFSIKPRLEELESLNSVNTTEPSYRFLSDLAGKISYTGACSSSTSQAVQGENTIVFSPLKWWEEYSDCGISITSDQNVRSSILKITPFSVEPRLIELKSLEITNTTTPTYRFLSDLPGKITYSGGCKSNTTEAIAGENTIVFNALEWWGDYSNCKITVTPKGIKPSTLEITPFSVKPQLYGATD